MRRLGARRAAPAPAPPPTAARPYAFPGTYGTAARLRGGDASAAAVGEGLSTGAGAAGGEDDHRPPRAEPADPVRELLHRYRELCEQAVDPLEIAAGLEARGFSDRGAHRFRHRDVFSLAEELYARVPHPADEPGALPAGGPGARRTGRRAAHGTAQGAARGRTQRTVRGTGAGHPLAEPAPTARGADPPADGRKAAGARAAPGRAATVLLPLLPGTVCAAALTALDGPWGTGSAAAAQWGRPAVGAAGALLVAVLARLALRKVVHAEPGWLTTSVICLLSVGLSANAALVTGARDGVLGDALGDGLDRALGAAPAPGDPGGSAWIALTLACAVAPAVWCARWFAARARRGLAASRDLEEFAGRIRPLLALTTTAYAVALVAVGGAAWALPAAGAGGTRAGADWARAAVAADRLGHRIGQGEAVGTQVVACAATFALALLLFTAVLLLAHGFSRAACFGVGGAFLLHCAALGVLACAWFAGANGRRSGGGVALVRPVATAVDALGPAAITLAACGCALLPLLVYAFRALVGASAHGTGAAAADTT